MVNQSRQFLVPNAGKKSPIVWIDVGTHYAQEHQVVFGALLPFVLSTIKFTLKQLFLGRGKLSDLQRILRARMLIKNRHSNFVFCFIEPNPLAFRKILEFKADHNFCLGLVDHKTNQNIMKLYIANGDMSSQGNSFLNFKRNVSPDNFILCTTASVKVFARNYKALLDEQFSDYSVMLRLNCEGYETEVIKAFSIVFHDQLKLAMGSLKDVQEMYGDVCYAELLSFIEKSNFHFVPFSQNPKTWDEALSSITDLLKLSHSLRG